MIHALLAASATYDHTTHVCGGGTCVSLQMSRKRLRFHTFEELVYVVLGHRHFQAAAFCVVVGVVGALTGATTATTGTHIHAPSPRTQSTRVTVFVTPTLRLQGS